MAYSILHLSIRQETKDQWHHLSLLNTAGGKQETMMVTAVVVMMAPTHLCVPHTLYPNLFYATKYSIEHNIFHCNLLIGN